MRVRGKFEVRMETECDRCLGRAQFPLSSSFDLFYQPVSFIAREEEVEMDEGEVEMGFYQGGGMELEDILREQVLLAHADAARLQRGLQGNLPVVRQEPQ